MTETTEAEPVHSCCGGYREHRYRCPDRAWPTTATPEVRRQAVRADCIAPAHARIEDLHAGLLGMRGLDYQQRKRLTEILAQVWDDGFGYAQQIAVSPSPTAALGRNPGEKLPPDTPSGGVIRGQPDPATARFRRQ